MYTHVYLLYLLQLQAARIRSGEDYDRDLTDQTIGEKRRRYPFNYPSNYTYRDSNVKSATVN